MSKLPPEYEFSGGPANWQESVVLTIALVILAVVFAIIAGSS